MARAKNKVELLNAMNDTYVKLNDLLNGFSKERLDLPFPFDESTGKEKHWSRDKNIRDVYAHLYEWQKMLIDWYKSNTNGEEKQFLREGYNWKTYGDMNDVIKEEYQSYSLEELINLLSESHKDIETIVQGLSDDELFLKGQFPWTNNSTLGSYIVSTTSSHYEWAYKKINKFKKSL